MDNINTILELLDRPLDLHITTELVTNANQPLFTHTIRDLCEHEMSKKHFLSKTNYLLLMTAMGDSYVSMLGIPKEDYVYLELPNTFDYSKSPIYLMSSGWLNAKNIDQNLSRCLMDTYQLCRDHKNEKGLVHTATNKITTEFRNIVSKQPDASRFLFYSSSEEKEEMVRLLKTPGRIPYVLVGPGLYEGLDLPDDAGRFQIAIKVPYDALSDYAKAKMNRYPDWYKNTVINKIIQMFGRTNRHVNDYSTIYCIDSGFNTIIRDTDASIISRIR